MARQTSQTVMKFEISFDSLKIDGLPEEEYDKRQRTRRRSELIDNLLFEVVSGEFELKPEERLCVLLGFGKNAAVHDAWVAKLYETCGCRAAARELFKKLGHHRKVGDSWLGEGREEEALASYRWPASEEPRRNGPDTDRIIAIHFRRGDWSKVLQEFECAGWEPWDDRQIAINRVVVSSAPWARAIAVAAARSGRLSDKSLLKRIKVLFALDDAAFGQLATWASSISEPELAKTHEKLLPRAMKKPAVTLEEAAAAGATPRAANLSVWIREAPDAMDRAKVNLDRWLTAGEQEGLAAAVTWIAGAVTYGIATAALFEFTDRTKLFHGPAGRVLELYRAHPFLLRYGMGHCLSILIQENLPFAGEDLLGGILQALAFPGRDLMPKSDDDISLDRLKACDDWAIQRLEDWASTDGKPVLDAARAALKALPGFKALDIRREEVWLEAMDQAIAWLGRIWTKELGGAPWKSEAMAFDLLKRSFKGRKVLQHDTPAWLTPQHLDIHIPEINLAVEYMGTQHYQPVEIFGGADAFARTQVRDARKADLCAAAGVTLEYIRYDENIGMLVAEIAARHGGDATPKKSSPGKKRSS